MAVKLQTINSNEKIQVTQNENELIKMLISIAESRDLSDEMKLKLMTQLIMSELGKNN